MGFQSKRRSSDQQGKTGKRKDRALVLILSLALLLMISLLATSFLSITDQNLVIQNSSLNQLRAELLAKSGQQVARLWLKASAGQADFVASLYFSDHEEQLSSFRGHDGRSSNTALAFQTLNAIDIPTRVQILLKYKQPSDTQNMGLLQIPRFFENVESRYAYQPSLYRGRPLNESSNPSLAYEVFEDRGIRENGVLVGANDNQFTFLDYGKDGVPETDDDGEGNHQYDTGELSESFSDLNGNGRFDGVSGTLGSSLIEFGNSYSLKVRDNSSMIYVNGGEPENQVMNANFPFVPVFFGDCSKGYAEHYYMTRSSNLSTIKLLNNLGIILSRPPIPKTGATTTDLWFDKQGNSKGLWIKNTANPNGVPHPLFGPTSQDPTQRGQGNLAPVSQLGLGDFLVLASTFKEDFERERRPYKTMEEVRQALVEKTVLIKGLSYRTQMTTDHFELLRDFITTKAWVDDTTVTGAKFWDPQFNNQLEGMFDTEQIMVHDRFDKILDPLRPEFQDERFQDVDINLSFPQVKAVPDPFRKFNDGTPLQVTRSDRGTKRGPVSRVFLGSTRRKHSDIIGNLGDINSVRSQRGLRAIDRTFPLVPGRWDAGFDRDTELDNLFGVVPEHRAPINLNGAPAAVLEAVFMGLEASYVTDAQNNLWPNRDLLRPALSRSLDRGIPSDELDDIRFDDRSATEIRDGMDRMYLYQWHEDYNIHFWPRSTFPGYNINNSVERDYQLPEWNWLDPNLDAFHPYSYHPTLSTLASLGIDLEKDWYRLNPSIEMTPSVVIYPIEAHELAKAIVNYRKGVGSFADVGINGRRGGPDDDANGGENNGKLDFNEDYNYTANESGSVPLIQNASYVPINGPNRITDWEQFMILLDCVKYRVFQDQFFDSALGSREQFETQRRLTADLKVDLVFANCNPNTDLLRFNPNASFAAYNRRFMYSSGEGAMSELGIPAAPAGTVEFIPRTIDKLDLFTPGERWNDQDQDEIFHPAEDDFDYEHEDLNGNGLYDYGGMPTHTTELIFETSGIFRIESRGQVRDGEQQVRASRSIRSTIRLFRLKRLTSQRDFEGVYLSSDIDYDQSLDSQSQRMLSRGIPGKTALTASRLRSYPEFDPQAWISPYQMHLEEPDDNPDSSFDELVGGPEQKVWRWIRSGADMSGSQKFHKSAAAVYDGQLALPTWELSPQRDLKAGEFTPRFYIPFRGINGATLSGKGASRREPDANDDLDAWYWDPDRSVTDRMKPIRKGTAPHESPSFNASLLLGMRENENNLDLMQKGLLTPEFWGIGSGGGTATSRRYIFSLKDQPGSWGTGVKSKLPAPNRTETGLKESQAYRHWPKSIPLYDREGGLTPDGVYRVGIRNLVYNLRSFPGGVPGYGKVNGQSQFSLKSILRESGSDWTDDDGRNLYATMWVKPAYSGNPRKNRYRYDYAEQFIKPHRLPNPVVWALGNGALASDAPGGGRRTQGGLGIGTYLVDETAPGTFFGINILLRYPRTAGFIEDRTLESNIVLSQEILMSKRLQPGDRTEYFPAINLPVERPLLSSGATPKSYGFPVWWHQTLNPIPPFPPYQSGTLGPSIRGVPAERMRMAGLISTTIPNILFDMKFYWAKQPWMNDHGTPDVNHPPGDGFMDFDSYNSVQLWHDIASPVFNHEVNMWYNGQVDAGEKPVVPAFMRSSRYGRDTYNGTFEGPEGSLLRNRIFGDETQHEFPHYGRPLTARLTRYMNIFKREKTGPAYSKLELGGELNVIVGRYLHWAVYDPPARNLQFDSSEDFLMKRGEWTRISYAIKEPVSATELLVPSSSFPDDERYGYHKILVFGTHTDDDVMALPPLTGTQIIPVRSTNGWWINRPYISDKLRNKFDLIERIGGVGNPVLDENGEPIVLTHPVPYWDNETPLNLEGEPASGDTVYDETLWPNRSTDLDLSEEFIQLSPGGQDAGYFGRLDQVNVGPGYAGTIDEFSIYGGISQNIGLQQFDSEMSNIERAPRMRNRYRSTGSYLSPTLERYVPSDATLAGITWSQFIPYNLKPDPGDAGGEIGTGSSIQVDLIRDGKILNLNGPMQMPNPSVNFPGENPISRLRIAITMRAAVNEDYSRRALIRSNRLLDTPVLDDITLRISLGSEEILAWEEF